MVTPLALDADLEATSCCCSSTQRPISGLGSLGPLRLRVCGVLWGVLGLRGLWGVWLWSRASLEALSPRFASICPNSEPVLRLASKEGLANAWPRLRATWMASCLSWYRFVPQAPHSPWSLSLKSVVDRLWTRRFSWRNADRSLKSCTSERTWQQELQTGKTFAVYSTFLLLHNTRL